MAEKSGISWTDATFNPWWGCVKVSEACKFCYAEEWAARWGTEWGPAARRRFFDDKHWNEPRRWDRKAAKAGSRLRVFCSSMADVFEVLPSGHPDVALMAAARARLWLLIEQTPNLDWLLLTKRPENMQPLTPEEWAGGWPANVWAGATAENQERANERVPELVKVPAQTRFLSCEPLLGPLDLTPWLWERYRDADGHRCDEPSELLHLVIGGGESGSEARATQLHWAQSLRDQVTAARVAFHWKQWGQWHPSGIPGSPPIWSKDKHHRVLDGRIWDEMPAR